MSRKSLKRITSNQTIASFYSKLDHLSKERIDCDPVGQRPDIESMSKRQGIIDTILRGYDFGELKLRTLPEAVRKALGYKFRSIDGGHRKRAIRDFIENKFKTGSYTVAVLDNGQEISVGGKYYKHLPEEVQDAFAEYEMRFVIFNEDMTDAEAGETFRRTNITTDVNWQEMLNSYEDNLVAKFIREISRPIKGLNNEYHPLFEYKSLNPEDRKQIWWSSASTRLRDDEFVTRFLTMLTKDSKSLNWLTCSNKENEQTFIELGDPITGVWSKDSKKEKQNKKLIIDALDFMLKYVKAKKDNSKGLLSTQEFTMVSRLYVYLNKKYESSFKVNDWNEFYVAVREAMDKFVGRVDTDLRTDTHKDNKGIRTVTECFRQYLTVHDDQIRSLQSIRWLLEELDIEDLITVLDPVRVFPKEMIEQVLRKQEYTCWVTGKSLDIKDAVGGHRLAYSEGGKTESENCVVCHSEENSRMGYMDAKIYRQARREELGLSR
jgi:hypothetical protein